MASTPLPPIPRPGSFSPDPDQADVVRVEHDGERVPPEWRALLVELPDLAWLLRASTIALGAVLAGSTSDDLLLAACAVHQTSQDTLARLGIDDADHTANVHEESA